jgi:thiol:disulfide interchange protein
MSPIVRLASLLALSCLALPAAAVDESSLLPVDQAFALGAEATDQGIAVHWKIADGYYLYRHRTAVSAEGAGFTAGTLQLPDGDKHTDAFFGPVETYRGRLDALLPGAAAAPGQVTLMVRYQGCADAGVCYPPQSRTVQVKVGVGAAPGQAANGLGLASAARGGVPLLGGPAAAAGASARAPLPQEAAFAFEAIAYDGNRLLLRFTPAKGYYLYRDRTHLALAGADGLSLGNPQWPPGSAHRDAHFGEVTVYFDQVEVPVPVLRERASAAGATLQATFQGCQTDGICYPPMTREVALSIPAGSVTPASERTAARADAATPDPLETGRVPPSAAAPAQPPRSTPPPEVLARSQGGGASTWLLALLGALLGGLILNVMPCVLPVLSLKALSLAEGGRGGGHARASALSYAAGVMLSFLLIGGISLALRATSQALGWGFQLQQPLVVAALVYVMFAVGLSLSGVFAVGYGLAGAGRGLAERGGLGGDFFTGVLAVVVAGPCTAPFMGTALAFAFAAPLPLALAVFALLGVGMALPFLLIGLVPGLARRLPRPGAWMDTLKQVLAFPMYLTAVWLLWVLGKQRGIDAVALALAGLVVLALGLWAFQRVRFQSAPLRRTLAVAVVLASLVPLALLHRLPLPAAVAAGASSDGAERYSPARLAQLRSQGQVVFVDMTADWCVTCKANEKAVLDQDDFRTAMRDADAVLMRGDWTNVDPQITAFLGEHKAVGVPLYVVFPRSGRQGEVLPTVLTPQRVRDALQRATRQ